MWQSSILLSWHDYYAVTNTCRCDSPASCWQLDCCAKVLLGYMLVQQLNSSVSVTCPLQPSYPSCRSFTGEHTPADPAVKLVVSDMPLTAKLPCCRSFTAEHRPVDSAVELLLSVTCLLQPSYPVAGPLLQSTDQWIQQLNSYCQWHAPYSQVTMLEQVL